MVDPLTPLRLSSAHSILLQPHPVIGAAASLRSRRRLEHYGGALSRLPPFIYDPPASVRPLIQRPLQIRNVSCLHLGRQLNAAPSQRALDRSP